MAPPREAAPLLPHVAPRASTFARFLEARGFADTELPDKDGLYGQSLLIPARQAAFLWRVSWLALASIASALARFFGLVSCV